MSSTHLIGTYYMISYLLDLFFIGLGEDQHI